LRRADADARSVAAYNAGSANGVPPKGDAKPPRTKLVAISPRDVGGGRLVATVTDLDGNVLGLLQDS